MKRGGDEISHQIDLSVVNTRVQLHEVSRRSRGSDKKRSLGWLNSYPAPASYCRRLTCKGAIPPQNERYRLGARNPDWIRPAVPNGRLRRSRSRAPDFDIWNSALDPTEVRLAGKKRKSGMTRS